MSYAIIHRQNSDDSITASNMLPNARSFILSYGFLIQRGEKLRLDEFATRIEDHYSHPRCQIEAGEIRRWYELMIYAEDHLEHFGALPGEFEWEDGLYSFDDCLKILGDPAIEWLLRHQHAA